MKHRIIGTQEYILHVNQSFSIFARLRGYCKGFCIEHSSKVALQGITQVTAPHDSSFLLLPASQHPPRNSTKSMSVTTLKRCRLRSHGQSSVAIKFRSRPTYSANLPGPSVMSLCPRSGTHHGSRFNSFGTAWCKETPCETCTSSSSRP